MKRLYLKLLMIAICVTGTTAFISCDKNNESEVESPIKFNDLPLKARTFLDTYFKDFTILTIEEEMDGMVTVYVVYIEGGYQVVFNTDGDWTQVAAPMGVSIPSSIIPEQVRQTLDERFPGYGVNQINTTGAGWKVNLTNGQGGDSITLFFDESGEIVSLSPNV